MANNIKRYRREPVFSQEDPAIWRRIQVPENYNFWGLHVAIQDSMGWDDYHLHVFRLKRKHAHKVWEIGIPNEDLLDILSNPNDNEYESMRTWTGEDYDPERFNAADIKFDNPNIRLRQLYR